MVQGQINKGFRDLVLGWSSPFIASLLSTTIVVEERDEYRMIQHLPHTLVVHIGKWLRDCPVVFKGQRLLRGQGCDILGRGLVEDRGSGTGLRL